MKNDKINLFLIIAILALFLVAGCASTPGLAGRWNEIGKTATLELTEDGTFSATDN